jgi:hypothetical protein
MPKIGTLINYVTRRAAGFTLLATWIGVIVAVGGACIAGVTLISTQKSARLSLGIEVLLRLDERFDTKRMRCARSRAAVVLISLLKNEITPDNERLREADDILDFFEELGLMFKEGVLNERFLHSYFFTFISTYWEAAEKYISYARQQESAVWGGFKYLYQRMRAVEIKVAGKYENHHRMN